MKIQYGVYDRITRARISPLFDTRIEAIEWTKIYDINMEHFVVSYINT